MNALDNCLLKPLSSFMPPRDHGEETSADRSHNDPG